MGSVSTNDNGQVKAAGKDYVNLKCVYVLRPFYKKRKDHAKMRYKHHKENYITNLEEGITPSGLQIKKKPAFLPVSEDFESKWNATLYDAEKNIIKLLMYESDQIIAKIEVDSQEELKEEDPNRF